MRRGGGKGERLVWVGLKREEEGGCDWDVKRIKERKKKVTCTE